MKIKFAIFLSSLYAATGVHANNFYTVGAVGQSHFKNAKSAADDALETDSGLTADGAAGVPGNFDNNDTGYKLQLGYAFNPNFAVEGGYVNLGEQNYRVDFSTGEGNAHVDGRGWNIDALGIIPVNGEFSVFGKIGAIDAKVNYHLSGEDADGAISDSREKYKWAPNYGVGASYAMNDETAVRLELERFADIGKKSTTGEQNVDLVSVGVSYSFN
ncbi:MAG: ompA-like transrane domain protein [Verrucomicrobiaceae bacterium]|nr:ompA-like transrane domain protein [Verrucomicrobiaceae bacterium]